jgi:glycosyltransferase involved in cell wall biosynthesis
MTPAMPAFLLDLTHTSHTRARTGIQRVARALHRELGDRALPVTHDPFLGAWRPLEAWEQANLAATTAADKRGAHWPWTARWRGRWHRATGRGQWRPAENCAGFLTAELFTPAVAASLPDVFPRVAIFHDAIALRYPELTPAGTVTRFPGYLRELLEFDGIAAASEESRESLINYWRWLGVTDAPPVTAIPLGVEPVLPTALNPPGPGRPPIILSVGTLEGRKNHLALLEACEQLWTRGDKFELHLVGALQAQTGRTALARVQSLQAAGRALRYDGPLSDDAVSAAYAACAFTVYPSLAEGFGLPVIESLAHGRPCVCSARGALGELSRLGGCLTLDPVDAPGLATALARLLASPAEVARLAATARSRTFKTWQSYARELTAWMQTLPRRPRP